jgi:hypothetical protein
VPKITKVLAPGENDKYLICIDGKSVGYPLSEEAANAKIDHLTEQYLEDDDGFTPP